MHALKKSCMGRKEPFKVEGRPVNFDCIMVYN